MNEKKEVERILADINSTECKISQILNLLIRYHINEDGMSMKDAIDSANKYVKSCFGGYCELEWESYNTKVAKSAAKKPLRDIESIPITQREIDEIGLLQDFKLQKLAFTCLVIAKMNKMIYDHPWINISNNDLRRLANLKHKGSKYINLLIHDLYISSYVTLSRKAKSDSFRYEKIYDDEVVCNVTFLSDLGYWWEYINGEKYSVCDECGRIYKPASLTQRYCFIHSAVYNKPLVCTCVDCGKQFQIEPGKRKRKRCECCAMERRLKYKADKERYYRSIRSSVDN